MDMLMDYIWAFVIGGAFCLVGQLLIDLTKLTPARILVAYVVAGVILGATGWYESLVEFAGAGATVPLTGFGYLLAKGVYIAVSEDGLMGAFTGGLQSCAGGITAAVIFGLIVALLFKRGDKTAKAI
ncbi:MAG: stage V sporulation protein AE [Eubacterium sp.]|nr:stage V sporulation protein AE [Eubacterium sp.]MCM1418109.1 stage V sporulation protein AE [Roseburia sp.]